jgi:23S rRNA (cytidine1920-2'-O)/16S rRNA (cytidine1409-2'-O)-methyltransferase
MRERLDALLVARGLFATRAQARAAVLAGEVTVDGRVVDKPGTQVGETAATEVAARRRYVSRGGDKLDHALETLGVDVTGEDVLDLGSSTGGFVDRVLQGGAARVIAVDVGYGQLDWKLREDPRVTVLERTNARRLTRERLPFEPSFVTADLSFISLTVALGPVLECLRVGFRGLVLVKPQFEAGRERVGKGGVVRDPAVHTDVLEQVARWLQARGAVVQGVCDSGHPGPKGNVEYFILFSDETTAGSGASPAAGLVKSAVEAVHG